MNYLIINGVKLVSTCRACPEQYDAYFEDKQIGYLRLRHGSFTASYPDVDGKCAYYGYPEGDGCFQDGERFSFLKEAVDSLIAMHNKAKIKEWDSWNE